jgi:hypothetical protein
MGILLRNNQIFGSSNAERPNQETKIIEIPDSIIQGSSNKKYAWIPLVAIIRSGNIIFVEYQIITKVETKNVAVKWNGTEYIGNTSGLCCDVKTDNGDSFDVIYYKAQLGDGTNKEISIRCLNTIPSGFKDLTSDDGNSVINPVEYSEELFDGFPISTPIHEMKYIYDSGFKPESLEFNIIDNQLDVEYDGEHVKTITNSDLLFSNGVSTYSVLSSEINGLLNSQKYYQVATIVEATGNLTDVLVVTNKNGNGVLTIDIKNGEYNGFNVSNCTIPVEIQNAVFTTNELVIDQCSKVILTNCIFKYSGDQDLVKITNSDLVVNSISFNNCSGASFIKTIKNSNIYINCEVEGYNKFDKTFNIDTTSKLYQLTSFEDTDTNFPNNKKYPTFISSFLPVTALGGVYNDNTTVNNIDITNITDITNSLPKTINGTLILNIAAGVGGNIQLNDLSGTGELIIKTASAPTKNSHIIDSVFIKNCSLRSIQINGFTSNTNSSEGISIINCNSNEIIIRNTWFDKTVGNGHTTNIFIDNCNSQIEINTVRMASGVNGIYAIQSNFIYVSNCDFQGVGVGIISESAIIHLLVNNIFNASGIATDSIDNGIVYSGDITQVKTPEYMNDSYIFEDTSIIAVNNPFQFEEAISGDNYPGSIYVEKRGRNVQVYISLNNSGNTQVTAAARIVCTLPAYLAPKSEQVTLDAIVIPHDTSSNAAGDYYVDVGAIINSSGEVNFINKTNIGGQKTKYFVITGSYFAANTDYK